MKGENTMLKKLFICLVTVTMLAVCGISAYAEGKMYDTTMCASRTGKDNTYMIQISIDVPRECEEYMGIAKNISKFNSDNNYYFWNVDIPFECTVTIDGTDYALGKGYVDGYFERSEKVYWTLEHTFTGYGRHEIKSVVSTPKSSTFRVLYDSIVSSPPQGYNINNAGERSNKVYAYSLIGLINAERSKNGLSTVNADYTLMKTTELKLLEYMRTPPYAYMNNEIYVFGASEPYEAFRTLYDSEKGRDLLYGNYKNIGIAAVCDKQNILHW